MSATTSSASQRRPATPPGRSPSDASPAAKPTQTIPATGAHDYDEGEITTPPTCTESGVKTYTCLTCGATHTEAVPPLGHGWYEWKLSTEPLSCRPGLVSFICPVCEDVIEQAVAPLDDNSHSFDAGVMTTAPTCTVPGVKTYICEVCGFTTDEEIPAIGHYWGPWVETVAPTETTTGLSVRTCLHDPSHTETQELPALSNPQPSQPDPQPTEPSPQPSDDGSAGTELVKLIRNFVHLIRDLLSNLFSR